MKLGKHAEALDYVTRAQQLDPSNAKISEDVISLRAKLDAGINLVSILSFEDDS
jgi:hypothetical protein